MLLKKTCITISNSIIKKKKISSNYMALLGIFEICWGKKREKKNERERGKENIFLNFYNI